jgi:hypothetical protein
MKRFNPLAGSGATVTVAPKEVETRPVYPHYGRGRRRRWEPRPARRIFTVITLTKNEAQNGLQIHFPSKPDETVRAELKAPAAGWRYSAFNNCWYQRATPENLAWATAFIARHGGQSEVPEVHSPEVHSPEPATADCGLATVGCVARNPQALWRQRLTTDH